MAVTHLRRTESAGSRTTFTWSAWVKRSRIGSSQMLAACSYSSSDEAYFFFNGGDKLIWQSSSASYGDLQTNRLFRDTSAWYHIVLAFDTTKSTASDRIKFYVNGVQETSFGTANYPSQNTQVYWNVGGTYYPRIGRRHASEGAEFDGSMSHIVHIDGTQELPTIFGETDSTTGEWKIKTSITPSVGWGTNGYHILKDGNSVTDQSGQNNNWTVQAGSLTKTEDNPSNVFCTFNVLDNRNNSIFSNGATMVETDYSNYSANTSTLRTITGKFYFEVKFAAGQSANEVNMVGINNKSVQSATQSPADIGINYRGNGRVWNYGGSGETGYDYPTFSAGDVVRVALDLSDATTGKLYFGRDATWGNSGNPETGAGSYNFTKGTEPWGLMVTTYSSGSSGMWQANFGNGYFASTQISSPGTNASGIGIFKYDVPTGYTALSTKGLNL